MNAPVLTYIAYLTISIALTVWVARTLHKNGRIFLVESFTATRDWPIRLIIYWWSGSISSISGM